MESLKSRQFRGVSLEPYRLDTKWTLRKSQKFEPGTEKFDSGFGFNPILHGARRCTLGCASTHSDRSRFLFAFEWLAVVAFGVSWLVKGEFLLKDT